MVNQDILRTKIEFINNHLERILPYRSLSSEEFLQDIKAQDIVEYNCFQIINHLIDLMEYIVVDQDYGLPQTAYEAAVILAEKGILEQNDLDLLKRMIGFRNVVGHDYIDIDKQIVYGVLTSGKDDIHRVLSKITIKFF